MSKLSLLMRDARRFLKVKAPINLILHPGTETPLGYDASHVYWQGLHEIEIAAKPSRGLLTVAAHELVHAAMDEQLPGSKVHGFAFQRRALLLENYLQDCGYKVHRIFWLGLDK